MSKNIEQLVTEYMDSLDKTKPVKVEEIAAAVGATVEEVEAALDASSPERACA